jgi:hypothetical protein
LHQVWWLQTQVGDALQAHSEGHNLQTHVKGIEDCINAFVKMPPRCLGIHVVKIIHQLQQTFNQSSQQLDEQTLMDLLRQVSDLESALKHH